MEVAAINPLALILSRIQFGLSVGVHFLFPIATLGLIYYLVIFEFLYVRTGREDYKTISVIGTKILGILFAFGVATGLIMPFSFGTNVSHFIEFAGNIFGVQLFLEILIAFMLESVFMGIVIFGRNKVNKYFYLLAMIFVFLGSHFSAFFIMSVNSWMQTPFHALANLSKGIPIASMDGFHLEQIINGNTMIIQDAKQLVTGVPVRAVLDSGWKVLFPSSWSSRLLHTVFGSWVAGSLIIIGLAAGLFIKNKETRLARSMFRLSAISGLVLSLAIIFLGHFQLLNLAKWQPVKNAAMEGTFQTRKGAWLYAIGWLDVKNRKSYSIGIPNALSFLDTGNIRAKIEGLDNILERGQDEFAKEGKDEYLMYEPPVQTIFQTFHFMVLLGLFLIGLFFYAVIICLKNTWQEKPWVWNMFIFSIPLPFLASELGWVSAEMGRQPWLVYGLLKTSAGISTVPLSYVVFSLSTYSILYIIFFIVLIKWVPKIIKENLA